MAKFWNSASVDPGSVCPASVASIPIDKEHDESEGTAQRLPRL